MNSSSGSAMRSQTSALAARASSAAMMSVPRAPPDTSSVPGPTSHSSKISAIVFVTLASASGGKRGVERSGWSIMFPLTTIAWWRNGIPPSDTTGLDLDRDVPVLAVHGLDADALALGRVGPRARRVGLVVEVHGRTGHVAPSCVAAPSEQLDRLDIGVVEVLAVRRHHEPVALDQTQQIARDVARAAVVGELEDVDLDPLRAVLCGRLVQRVDHHPRVRVTGQQ